VNFSLHHGPLYHRFAYITIIMMDPKYYFSHAFNIYYILYYGFAIHAINHTPLWYKGSALYMYVSMYSNNVFLVENVNVFIVGVISATQYFGQ